MAQGDVQLGLGGEIEPDTRVFRQIMRQVAHQQHDAVVRIVQGWAVEATQWMKENAPWDDQTGNARKSLGIVQHVGGDAIVLVLTGGVYYLLFLETREAGKRPILVPATMLWGSELLKRVGAVRTG